MARPAEVGVIGLGTMGGQMAGHLLAAGYRVTGRDTVASRAGALAGPAFTPAGSVAEVAGRAEAVIVSLPSVRSFTEVAAELAASAPPGLVVIEASTLPLEVKSEALRALSSRGAVLLDCPISGTGAQLRTKDVVVYASGDGPAVARVAPVLGAFSRSVIDLGEFGNGTRLKLVANLLVAVHNVAAAEALLLAERAGLDLPSALAALTAGAGTSRMLEVRGPLMTSQSYGDAAMAVRTFAKDLDIIAGFARDLECPAPVFGAASQVHLAALAQGHGDDDTASVSAVLHRLAGLPAPAAPAPASSGPASSASGPEHQRDQS